MDCRIFCSEIKESTMNMPLMGGEKGKLLIGSKLNACLLLLAAAAPAPPPPLPSPHAASSAVVVAAQANCQNNPSCLICAKAI